MHYKTFDVIDVDPEEFVSKVTSLGKEAQILTYGESLEF
jgi:L-ascorbate metabolism protein UlaG (beta-lactamase superfamily)